MAVREILLLGNPFLYEKATIITPDDMPLLDQIIKDLHDTLFAFREKHGFGRAIAAPQIGYGKQIIYMFIDKPQVIINPVFDHMSSEMFEVWDDCMSFPNLLVKVERHKRVEVSFSDEFLKKQSITFEDSLSELIQHEMDHLEGVLAVMKAKDKYSFKYKI